MEMRIRGISSAHRLYRRASELAVIIFKLFYGPKFVENIVQATSRDILVNSMKTLRNCSIVAHVHDELIIECDPSVSLEAVCEQMGRVPKWADGLLLREDGYVCDFYQKD